MSLRLWGAPQRVNLTTAGNQMETAVARLANGTIVVAWMDPANAGDILMRLFNTAGAPLTGEITVAANASAESSPSIAPTQNGGFAVAFNRGSVADVRWYDGAGAFVGDNTGGVFSGTEPSAAAFGTGQGLLMAVTTGGEIDVVRFDAAGALTGFTSVNTTTAGFQTSPQVIRLSDGRYAFAWGTLGGEVRARLADSSGNFTLGADFEISTTTLFASEDVRMTALTNGGFVVTWSGSGGPYPASDTDIRARIISSTGVPVGAVDFLVNVRADGDQQRNVVVATANGGFAAFWVDNLGPGSTDQVRGQLFDAAGQRIGGDIQVSTVGDIFTSDQVLSATLLADGRIAVVWAGAGGGDSFGVQMQIVDPRAGFVEGSESGDTLYGGDVDDQILGKGGNDTIFAQGGDDGVYGGIGNDLVFGLFGSDVLYGADGADTLNGGSGDDQVLGEDGNDTLIGELGDDLLIGGDGNDTINGSAGQDALYGGVGNDVMLGENGDDAIFGQDGDDTAFLGAGNDVANGDAGGDNLSGEAGDDLLEGGTGGDVLNGGAGVDNLMGGTDGDILIGGGDGDRLEGGTGGDVYWYQATSEGNDLIVGFVAADDQLQFTGAAFGFAPGASLTPGSNFIVGAAPVLNAPTFVYNNGALYFDLDGTGPTFGLVFLALLQGAPALTAGDFQFV